MVRPASSPKTYPPDLDDAEQVSLSQVVKDWTVANGLVVRPPPSLRPGEPEPAGVLATHVPVTLFPSPFPRSCYHEAKAVQKMYNELYASVSRDEHFLASMVDDVGCGDDFIKSLWRVHSRVKEEGYVQTLSLGLFRSDYLVHQEMADPLSVPNIKQVEFNTIASSFGGLSTATCSLHRFLAETQYPILKQAVAPDSLSLPLNDSVEGLAGGLRAAFEAYAGSELGLETCIVFLVQDGERNVFDQRHLEYALQKSAPRRIPVFRLHFSETLQRTRIAETPARQLLYRLPSNPEKEFEVAVVYLRAGYGPSDYPDTRAWDARYHLERSAAIKCPSVLTQLAGAKKVQQALATPGPGGWQGYGLGLSRFVPEGSQAFKDLLATFTNIFPMDDSEAGLVARKLALDAEECKRYVLKPQREGGGNNCYRGAIPPLLKSLPEAHWRSYILMELITPPPVHNIILRNGRLEQGGVICELGIYGSCVWDQGTGDILHNEEAGYLLRTKGVQSEEGGVAAGFGSMDSCNLV